MGRCRLVCKRGRSFSQSIRLQPSVAANREVSVYIRTTATTMTTVRPTNVPPRKPHDLNMHASPAYRLLNPKAHKLTAVNISRQDAISTFRGPWYDEASFSSKRLVGAGDNNVTSDVTLWRHSGYRAVFCVWLMTQLARWRHYLAADIWLHAAAGAAAAADDDDDDDIAMWLWAWWCKVHVFSPFVIRSVNVQPS